MIEVFRATIKPILLYGSETWGYQSKMENKIENVQTMFGKHILGVHRKSTNIAVMKELGLRPLKLEMQINALKYYDYLDQNRNGLLKDALVENKAINGSWYNNIINIIDETNIECNNLLSKDNCKDDITYKFITKKNNETIKKYCTNV